MHGLNHVLHGGDAGRRQKYRDIREQIAARHDMGAAEGWIAGLLLERGTERLAIERQAEATLIEMCSRGCLLHGVSLCQSTAGGEPAKASPAVVSRR